MRRTRAIMHIRTVNKRFLLCLVLAIAGLLPTIGCSKSFENRDPQGLNFPSVIGEVLTGEEVEIPRVFQGKPTLLLVGYVQDTQFDLDRWILGLKQLKTPIEIAEIPSIQGLLPRMLKSKIDQGMRNGIPQEDWGIVITVYADADKIARFLGNTKPRNTRVVLVDEVGKVVWFHDRGYSADKALELDKQVRKLMDNS